MTDFKEKLLMYAKESGVGQHEFEMAIRDIYAGIVDVHLDKDPELVYEQVSTFGGHRLIIECYREFLN